MVSLFYILWSCASIHPLDYRLGEEAPSKSCRLLRGPKPFRCMLVDEFHWGCPDLRGGVFLLLDVVKQGRPFVVCSFYGDCVFNGREGVIRD